MNKRGSGILLHITSLPSPFGIGDLGPDAYRFVDFLSDTMQSYWQILPVTPTLTIFREFSLQQSFRLCRKPAPYKSSSFDGMGITIQFGY